MRPSDAVADPELNFGGGIIQNWTLGGQKCLFHEKSFLALFQLYEKLPFGRPWPPAPFHMFKQIFEGLNAAMC